MKIHHRAGSDSPSTPQHRPDRTDDEVDAAERRVGNVLQGLEEDTGGEVADVDLQDVVDTDVQGRPVLKKKVEIEMKPRKERHWVR